MKKLFLSIAMMTFIAATVSVSSGQEPFKQPEKALDTLKGEMKNVVVAEQVIIVSQIDSVAEYQNLTVASEFRFTENDKSIADLKLNNTSKDLTKKTAKNKEIDVLEQKNISLRKELAFYKEDGKTEWKTFKKQFNSDMDKLTQDLKNMKNLAIL